MEHTTDHHVTEENMHPDYHERETRFRDQAATLWDKESNARAQIRTDVSLSEEERMDRYIAVYGGLEKTLDELSGEIGREEGKAILEATETLYGGGAGKKFSEHLASVANVPDERLSSLMATATRSGQGELARAVALTAYERGERGLFNSWAESNPERAAALERIKGTPGAEQFYTRTKLAMRPPKAALADLIPTPEDERMAAEAEAASNVTKYAAFFGPTVPRQVGGRRSE
jgi:hypothetical protein